MGMELKSLKKIARSICEVKRDLKGFGGHCAAGALALNEVCFGNKAEIKGVFNKAFVDKNRYVGHFYLYFEELSLGLDCDGVLRPPAFFEKYAVIDPSDPEDLSLMDRAKVIVCKDLYKLVTLNLQPDSPEISRFSMDYLEHNKQVLQKML